MAAAAPRRRWLAAAAWLGLLAVVAGLAAGKAGWIGRGAEAAPDVADPKAVTAPRPLSISELLAGHSDDWRVARQQDNAAVLVIEFPNLAAQGAAMNRVAALLEKADAPRDRVLSDTELAQLIARGGDNAQTFYQGHDYDGTGMARFYAQVARQRLPLNAPEQRLRAMLLAQGVLTDTPAGLQPVGEQALITFTATQPDDPSTPIDETIDERRRESVLRHESSHGRFYTRPAYREHCRRFWHEQLTAPQRDAFRSHLAKLGYDRRNEELMLNEAQALLFHTPDTRAFRAEDVGIGEAQLNDLRLRFWRSLPADAVDAGVAAPLPAAASRP